MLIFIAFEKKLKIHGIGKSDQFISIHKKLQWAVNVPIHLIFSLNKINMYIHFFSFFLSFRLFAGVIPRTMWISLGGAVFFGIYEKSKNFIQSKMGADK